MDEQESRQVVLLARHLEIIDERLEVVRIALTEHLLRDTGPVLRKLALLFWPEYERSRESTRRMLATVEILLDEVRDRRRKVQ